MMYEHVCISIFHCLYFEKEIHLLMINISTIWDEKLLVIVLELATFFIGDGNLLLVLYAM